VKIATEYPCFAALSCSNLLKAAQALRKRYPAAQIIVLADVGNGAHQAEVAAHSVGGRVATLGEDRSSGSKDFSDLHRHSGAEAVKRAVDGARAPQVVEYHSNMLAQEALVQLQVSAEVSTD
jgi:putative DNA primase/helicase